MKRLLGLLLAVVLTASAFGQVGRSSNRLWNKVKPKTSLDTDASIILTKRECQNGYRYNNDAGVIDYAVYPAELDLFVLFFDKAGGVITVDLQDDADIIVLDGTALAAGNAIDSPGDIGDYIVLHAVDDTYWMVLGKSGAWIDGGAD